MNEVKREKKPFEISSQFPNKLVCLTRIEIILDRAALDKRILIANINKLRGAQ